MYRDIVYQPWISPFSDLVSRVFYMKTIYSTKRLGLCNESSNEIF
jgi:hypothetical protein